jgi:hypothetical protein
LRRVEADNASGLARVVPVRIGGVAAKTAAMLDDLRKASESEELGAQRVLVFRLDRLDRLDRIARLDLVEVCFLPPVEFRSRNV